MSVPFQDRFYDPNYQTMRRFDLRLLPRDHLMFECTYNSTGRKGITRGGFSSGNEMCVMFLHYYPSARYVNDTTFPSIGLCLEGIATYYV